MHEWLDAFRYEVEETAARTTGIRMGSAVSGVRQQVDSALAKGVEQTDAQAEGAVKGPNAAAVKIGEAARAATRFLAGLPVLSLTADTAMSRNCVDLIATDVRRRPFDPMSLMHLAEALESARRDRVIVRYTRAAVDPTSMIGTVAVRTTTKVGAGSRPTTTPVTRTSPRQ